MFLDLDGHRYVFASKAGAHTDPDWYHYLVAHPDVTPAIRASQTPRRRQTG